MTVLAAIAMALIAAVAGWVDLRRGIIPARATMGVAIAGVVLAIQGSWIALFENSLTSIAILGTGHGAWWAVYKMGKGPFFGRGDWNLMAAAAIGLGVYGTWLAAVVALSSALLAAVVCPRGLGPYGAGTVVLGPFLGLGICVGAYVLCAV